MNLQPVLRHLELDARPHLLERKRGPRPSGDLSAPGAEVTATAPSFASPVQHDGGAERSQAESLVEVEAARRSSFEQARAEGLLQGRKEAQAEAAELKKSAAKMAAEAAAAAQARFQQILHSATAQSRAYLSEAEDDMVALAHAALCSILSTAAPSPAVVRAITRQLIDTHRLAGKLAVHLHPDDLASLGPTPQTEEGWEWVADSTVQMGGVLLRKNEGSLDARLETQLESLRLALVRTRKDRAAAAAQASTRTQQGVQAAGAAGGQQ